MLGIVHLEHSEIEPNIRFYGSPQLFLGPTQAQSFLEKPNQDLGKPQLDPSMAELALGGLNQALESHNKAPG